MNRLHLELTNCPKLAQLCLALSCKQLFISERRKNMCTIFVLYRNDTLFLRVVVLVPMVLIIGSKETIFNILIHLCISTA